MRRYLFAATFTNPRVGPQLLPLPPFDKVEIVQAEDAPYPPPDTCLVSVECQAHTALVDVPEDMTPDAAAVAVLEAQMDVAALLMSATHAYIGMEVI